MSGGVVTRGRERRDQQNGQNSKTIEQKRDEEQVQHAEANSLALTMRSGLEAISKEIRDLKTEMKKDLTTLKEQVTEDVKSEINDLKREMYQQLSANTKTLQAQGSRIAEAEGRIAETETWNMEVKDALCKSLKQQQMLQDKLTDIEGRSRRNNIRIFGIPEDKEGDSAPKYLHQLLTTELSLPPNVNLQIQRAHRALAQKPNINSPPRSMIVHFLEFTVKEMVLKKAWQKKIVVEGRPLIFDHDYATEVVQKRKAYNGIKKLLKEKGIRFQTPLTKMRIPWDDGPKLYGSAQEAACDMRKRGFSVGPTGLAAPDHEATLERLQQAMPWQRVGERREGTARSAKEKLQEFERITQDSE
ncbi:LINE-1 retrotransposable element ORF1 protein [Dissostichus eleginoides]|uniref:LINE-1 retrotransposable element ORF1 protein n=1 Tax=Dissostichus eleginoides TaxID=100907 RepID=A0AAD9C5X3_DISEL|nr:LINE-1 retrotransposable element ORF1 protein [Dissostichus eleginoides]